MKVDWRHKLSGIYCIKNVKNGKLYVGKSTNIASRIHCHIYDLDNHRSHCSKLQNAWKKYGTDNFEYFILEKVEDIQLLFDKECFWIDKLDSINKGYNLVDEKHSKRKHHISTIKKLKGRKGKLNPNYGKKWPEERKRNLSELKKKMIKEGIIKPVSYEAIQKGISNRRRKWKENPDLIRKMVERCNIHKIKYEIHQLTEDNQVVKIWKDIIELTSEHPEYKRHNIYAVCSGEKKRMYGYKWKKVQKQL